MRGSRWGTLATIFLLAGCASSGDVEQARQESAQAKAKMSAELQQERQLAATMEKESEAQKAQAEKLAKVFGGSSQPKPLTATPLKATGSSMSLTDARKNNDCLDQIAAQGPNPAVPQALFIGGTLPTKGGNSACTSVTVYASDTNNHQFSATSPLIPVVVGEGGVLLFQDQPMILYASSFLIKKNAEMRAGSPTAPIQSQITIVMAGNSSAAPPPSGTQANMRDITVMDEGTLKLYGAKGQSAAPGTLNKDIVSGTKSWTYLAMPAGPSKYSETGSVGNVSAPVPTTNPDTTLTLATTVDWQVKDWISVATTSFSSHQTEIVQICAITSVPNPDPKASALGLPLNVSQITLRNGTNCTVTPNNTPLKHYHYGGLAPTPGFFPANTTQQVVSGGNPINVSFQARSFYDGPDRNYGIDERAEVALLWRNIKLTSVAGQSGDANNFIGGHLVAMVSTGLGPDLQLVGVEIEKFGQGLVGRYPVHLHKLPSGNKVLIQDVSVHHSYNKCYVVHGTGNANFYNNVCVRTVGQGFYLEDGDNITGNQFMRNHVAGAMAAQSTYSYPQTNQSQYWDGDNLQGYHYSTAGKDWYQNPNWYNVNNVPDTSASGRNSNPVDSSHPGGFWITNLGNTFVNNSVAGCQAKGRGYWLLAQGSTSNGYPEFTGNRVHGCYNGIDNDDTTGNTVQPYPMLSSGTYAPVLLLTDNTITRSRNKAAWFRNWYATLHNHRFATNLRGFSLLVGGGPEGTYPGFWSLVYQNVIAGMTRNNVERYPDCGNGMWQAECTNVAGPTWGNYPDTKTNIQGYSYYDGPARIEHNRFVNFRFDPTGIYPNARDQAARLMTQADKTQFATYGPNGQLTCCVTNAASDAAPSSNYQGYVGDVANGWQTSNAQTVPPTQYIRDSIWDNVDFKHQVYTEAVNMGPFNDGDKTTVIRDLDSQLSGLKVVDSGGTSHSDIVPISLNSVDFFATDYTVDEPHSRGPNDFRSTSLMSPHKYATLNIESVSNPPYGGGSGTTPCPSSVSTTNPPYTPTCFRMAVQRDMPAYGDTVYPILFLNGRGQNSIYEPFVMDRMGYTVYGLQGAEHNPPYTATALQDRLLFSYTDPPVHKAGDYFVNRIAVYQPVTTPANITVYRIRRQWGGQPYGSFPPDFQPPVPSSCDHTFFDRQAEKETKWADCLKRGKNPDSGRKIQAATGQTLADQWANFEQPYKTLMAISNPTSQDIQNFISGQTFYYDTTSNLLYFYMIEDKPVQKQYSPYGTCNAAQYSNYVAQIQGIKSFSDPNSVQAALDASCLVSGGTPQPSDLFVCNEIGCAAYLVDFSAAGSGQPATPQPITNVTSTGSGPFVVSTSATLPSNGEQVVVTGVQGSPGANGIWRVSNANTPPGTFTLQGSTGSGTYTSGGSWNAYPVLPTEVPNPQAIATFTLNQNTPSCITSSTAPPDNTTIVVSGVQQTNGNPIYTAVNNTWVASSNTTGCPAGSSFTLKNSAGTGYGLAVIPGTGSWNAYPPVPAPQPITKVTSTGSGPFVVTTFFSQILPSNGTQVVIAGVQGSPGANGIWTVANVNTTAGTFTLQGSTGSGTYTSGTGTWNILVPHSPHPISRADYSNWNQYHLVYGTPAQEPNGIPVPNTAPADGTPLPTFQAPHDGTAPPHGNNISYGFLPLSGGPNGGNMFPVTENFRYHCVTTPPWAPVNPRGAYPPSGGFTYPLPKTVCD